MFSLHAASPGMLLRSLLHGRIAPGGQRLRPLFDGLLGDELDQVVRASSLVVGTWVTDCAGFVGDRRYRFCG